MVPLAMARASNCDDKSGSSATRGLLRGEHVTEERRHRPFLKQPELLAALLNGHHIDEGRRIGRNTLFLTRNSRSPAATDFGNLRITS